jgi:hypothetical protein
VNGSGLRSPADIRKGLVYPCARKLDGNLIQLAKDGNHVDVAAENLWISPNLTK